MALTVFNSTQTQNKVLQYVVGTKLTSFGTTSSTFQATGLTVSITPTSTTSKILVLVSSNLRSDTSTNQAVATIFRGATNLAGSTFQLAFVVSAGGMIMAPCSMMVIDSPATVSATTYEAYLRNSNNTNTVEMSGNNGGLLQSIIAVELAA